MKKLTVIIPVYFNEENLDETITHLLSLREKIFGFNFEFIFIDDGSKDNSWKKLLNFKENYPDIIKIIKFTRNFGSMMAIQAGLQQSTGDCVGVISADLQDPPDLFIEMIRYWENGIKNIFAVRKNREDGFINKFFSNTFYILLNKFAIPNYPNGGFDFFLIDRQVVDEIINIKEKNSNLMSLIFWCGYDYVIIPYVRKAREKGKSRWTIITQLNNKAVIWVWESLGYRFGKAELVFRKIV